MDMNTLARTIDRFNERVGQFIMWLSLLMVFVGAYNALARWLDKGIGSSLSSNTWLETGWYLFAMLFLFSAAWGLRQNAHVRVDVVYARLSTSGKAWVDLIGTIVLLIPFSLFMILASLPAVFDSWSIWEMSPDPGGLPRWPIKTALPLAFAMLTLQGISTVINSVTRLRSERMREKNG